MNTRTWLVPLLLAVLLLLTGIGCPGETQNPSRTAPMVTVAHPWDRTVEPDREEFTGRTAAPKAVDVRARVSGYLDRVLFADGQEVKAGDPLFEIDPRSYQAQLDRAQGQVTQTEARLARLEKEYTRAQKTVSTGAIAREEYEKIAGDRAEADAALKAAKANLEGYKLDLSFCKVAAPISGRVSRTLIDPGNLVKADTTVLTNIVAVDPMYATFDIDEATMLRVQRLIREGKAKSARDAGRRVAFQQAAVAQMVLSLAGSGVDAPWLRFAIAEQLTRSVWGDEVVVFLSTSDEKGLFPHQGTLNFIDNRVDPTTGNLRARATFPNPKVNAKGEEDPNGTRVLSPGLFVRVQIPVGEPYKALLVTDRALISDQGQKFVYVVADGKAVRRQVEVGPLKDGLRVILKGVEPSDLIVVNGIQRVRVGQPVRHEQPVPMSSLAATTQPAQEVTPPSTKSDH